MGGSNLARIEKSAQKQAKSGSGSAGWYEKWYISIHFFLEQKVGLLSLRILTYRLRATFLVRLESHGHVLVRHVGLIALGPNARGVIYLSDNLSKFAGKIRQLASLGLVCVLSHLAASLMIESLLGFMWGLQIQFHGLFWPTKFIF